METEKEYTPWRRSLAWFGLINLVVYTSIGFIKVAQYLYGI